MNAITDNTRAVMGGNNPPTPFDAIKARIDDLYGEAKNWLDGAPIDTAGLAAGVERLEADLKAAIKIADDERKCENTPFDEGKAEVQARYNLLIGDTKSVKGVAIRALEACKAALTPWRVKVQAEKDAVAEEARRVADEKAAVALSAHKAASASADLQALEAADALLEESGKANRQARAAEKAVTTKTGLRTTYHAEITDLKELARHVWTAAPVALATYLQEWADQQVRAAGSGASALAIPGVSIRVEKESR